ncbi:hypothetical protein OIU76_007507 [Salix suchowensis]|nr:hypothetical protein OIU76_007507 [Salix suchowensis]
MDAAATVSSLRDKLKALLKNKEVTPARLKGNKIKCYIRDLNDGHELLTKQTTDGLDSKLLRCAYEVEDIIDSFVLRAELQRQTMLTKMRSFIPMVSTCCQKSLSDELKEPMGVFDEKNYYRKIKTLEKVTVPLNRVLQRNIKHASMKKALHMDETLTQLGQAFQMNRKFQEPLDKAIRMRKSRVLLGQGSQMNNL